MSAPRFGRQVKTVDRCKICGCAHRAEIEDMIVIGRRGELLDNGIKPTQKWIQENAERLWGITVNASNIHAHFKADGGHFVEGDPAELEQQQRDLATEMVHLVQSGDVEMVSIEKFCETVIALGYQRVLLDPSKVTIQDALKAAAELTKRKHDETTAKLMQALAAGTEAALRRIEPPKPPDQIVDAEIVQEIPPPREEADGAA